MQRQSSNLKWALTLTGGLALVVFVGVMSVLIFPRLLAGSDVGEAAPEAAAALEIFELQRVWSSTHDDWEPANAVDPNSAYVYQLTTRYGGPLACATCPDPALILRVSDDGGETWGEDQFICPCPNVAAQNDPQVEVASDGSVYAVWMNDWHVVISMSADHGQTWTEPARLNRDLAFSDKPILALSPDGRRVYVAFNASDSYVVFSHDFGETFSDPVRINSDALYWFAAGGAVAPDGAVYFSETVYNQGGFGSVKVVVLRSTDGGAAWTPSIVDTVPEQPDCASGDCPPEFFGPQVVLAIDRAGVIMVAYNANTEAKGSQQLWIRTSNDGVNWSDRRQISGGRPGANSAFPALAVGSAACDFRAAWAEDARAGEWNIWQRHTKDCGESWSPPVQLSDLGPFGFPYGDYFEIDVDAAGRAHVIWSEAPSYDGPGHSWYTRGE